VQQREHAVVRLPPTFPRRQSGGRRNTSLGTEGDGDAPGSTAVRSHATVANIDRHDRHAATGSDDRRAFVQLVPGTRRGDAVLREDEHGAMLSHQPGQTPNTDGATQIEHDETPAAHREAQ
jgi:hypothetical protein